MHRLLKTIIIFFIFSQTIYATTIDKIIVFGDSLSDNGNIYSLTRTANKVTSRVPVIPKNPPYYEGRFTNGVVWVETLAQTLGVPLVDYAYGGAWVEGYQDSKQIIPFDLGMQVNFYLVAAVTDFYKSNHLYVIWAGSNDYAQGRDRLDYATTNTVNVIKKQIDWLISYGAKNFLIVNLPDLGLVPESTEKGPDFIAMAHTLSVSHNEKLAKMLAAEKQEYPDIKFISADITAYFKDLVENPIKYSLKNSKEACYGGDYFLSKLLAQFSNRTELAAAQDYKITILNNASLKNAYLTAKLAENGVPACGNPDDYLFWDHIHPTRVIHQLISTLALNVLHENDIQGITKQES